MIVIDLEIDVIWPVWSTQAAQVSPDHNNTAQHTSMATLLDPSQYTTLLNAQLDIIQFIIWTWLY